MPIRIWWRRTWWVFPCALVLQFLVMRNVQPIDDLPGWRVNWGWMLGVWNGGTILMSPFLAAVAAMVMMREWPHGVREQVAPLPRGRSSTRHIFTVLYLQGLAAMAIALAVGAAMCVAYGAPIESATLPWQFLTGPAALLASVLLGLAVGALFGDILVVPLLGFGVFLAHQIFFWSGFPELFTTEVPTWFYEEARPKATHLIATITLNIAVGAALLCFLDWITRLPGMRPRWLLLASGALLATAMLIYTPWVLANNTETYELIG
ncbi:MAG: hypothetical protein IPJ61_16605 [Tessaracoccus sp.]|uniref:hypothetical protein n=1 Tax=Tessaracoccus sp. TaxID=1971211 RepID=UPI001ED246C8|nr:hypothetical protein [Tessaracoccus sp.]MBK7822632.1 hypothetical protein [Tessaracoccus sp.]